MQMRIAALALPLAVFLMTILPPVGVLLTGRNIATFEALEPLVLSSLATWVLRLGTLASVAALAAAVVFGGGLGLRARTRPVQLALIVGFLVFFATNVLSPAFLGAVPSLALRAYPYTLLLFLALYAARAHVGDGVLDAARSGLVLLILGSIVFAVVWPTATLRPYADELRLPLVPFRFWGLGSGPNSIAPLALTLLLLVMARPFARRWLQRAAWISAALVIVLAQSQTTWIAAVLIVPLLVLYRRRLARPDAVPLQPPTVLALAMIGMAAGIVVLMLAVAGDGDPVRVSPTGGLPGDSELLTGRGGIWRVAFEVFARSPLFGYGLGIWEDEFRSIIAMSYAVHAHNQLVQSLSMAGLVGGVGLAVYVVVLVRASLATAAASGGLAPALLVLVLVRSLSEVPLQLQTLLVGDVLMHALLFAVIMAAASAQRATPTEVRLRLMPEARRPRRALRPAPVAARRRRRA
jgi:O-antigen ligase